MKPCRICGKPMRFSDILQLSADIEHLHYFYRCDCGNESKVRYHVLDAYHQWNDEQE